MDYSGGVGNRFCPSPKPTTSSGGVFGELEKRDANEPWPSIPSAADDKENATAKDEDVESVYSVAAELRKNGVAAYHYHAGQSAPERRVVQCCWTSGSLGKLCTP